jgi:hypothetical protein
MLLLVQPGVVNNAGTVEDMALASQPAFGERVAVELRNR